MRRHAKASSAGSTSGRDTRLGLSVPGAFDTHAASADAKGSSASSRCRIPLLALSLAVVVGSALVAAVPALASKGPISRFASSGNFGGQLSRPDGVAVNSTGAGPAEQGDVYVVDEPNNRVERFDKNGNFISAWGKDVIASSVNERQHLFIDGAAGTYMLTFKGSTTEPIPYNAKEFQIRNALGALPSIGGTANVAVLSGFEDVFEGNFTVTFQGTLAAADQPQITADDSQLAGSVEVSTVADGSATAAGTGFEICAIAAQCKAGLASGGDGTMAGNGSLNQPQAVAVDGDTGNVYVSDRENRRIDTYDGAGHFLFSVGRDVAEPNGDTAVEICNGATEACRQGDGGSGLGEIGATTELRTLGLAVSPPDGNPATGTLYLADSQNRRVVTYNLDGTSPASFGSSANFGTQQPQQIAADSRGVVYASNDANGGEVERYDTADANGGGVGFLTPITAATSESQQVTFTGFQNNDSFTLTCPDGEVTDPITFLEVYTGSYAQSALDAKCGASNVIAEMFGTMQLRFRGAYSQTNVPTTTCTKVAGFGSCTVSVRTEGHPGTLQEAPSFVSTFPSFDTATAGLAVDPDLDGAGPDSDALYVLRGNSARLVQQIGPATAPGLTAAPTVVDDTHNYLVSGGSNAASLGLDEQSGRLYVPTFQNRVYVLSDPASLFAPVPVVDPITVNTDSTATFTGSVDPKNGQVSCKFQYSTSLEFTDSTDLPVPGCAFLSVDGGAQPVSKHVAGLDPNTHYYVRLVVSRPFIQNSSVNSFARGFDTDAPAPAITDLGSTEIGDISARLAVTIDPRHSPTGYVFQYGLTPALGSSTAPLDIGAGTTPVTVSQVVSGLAKDTGYYFRVVATNLTGTTTSASKTFHTRATPFPSAEPGNCPNQAIRQAQNSTYLPDCMAYEMVSPPDKNQGGVAFFPFSGFARDGNAAGFLTSSLFGEPPAQQGIANAPYISRRAPDGWSTETPSSPFCTKDLDNPGGSAAVTSDLSPNFDRALVTRHEFASCPIPPLDSAALPGKNLYRADFSTHPRSYELVAPNPGAGVNFVSYPDLIGGSEDFSHLFYSSIPNQTAEPDSPPQGNFAKLYEWEEEGQGSCETPGGCLRLASVDPAGNPFTTSSAAPGDRTFGGKILISVSADGGRLYFQNPGGQNGCQSSACKLYMREGGATTYEVSSTECTTACGSISSEASFAWTGPAGDVAIFTSCDKLTDASAADCAGTINTNANNISQNAKLYRWDRNAPPGHRLIDISADKEPADGDQPKALDILGASDDGDAVYFLAGGQIVVGEPTPPGLKIYRWDYNGGSPSVSYLGPYGTFSYFHYSIPYTDTTQNNEVSTGRHYTLVTPDGRYLVILTSAAINPAVDRDADADLYRWSEAEGWRCISCQAPGVPSNGNANDFKTGLSLNNYNNELSAPWPVPAISDDGQRVFFSTPDALVHEDVNGDPGCTGKEFGGFGGTEYSCTDVYEWHDGTVSLITTGAGVGHLVLMGATHTGDEAFFLTRDRLTGWDVDNAIDMYVARVDGGFPEPPAQPPSCEGEACRGPATVVPAGVGAGTAVFEGPGNPKPKHGKPRNKRKRHHHRAHKRHHKRAQHRARARAANHDRRAHR